MNLNNRFFPNIVILLTGCISVSKTISHTYQDCTEIIKQNIVQRNNGTLQFQYTHYPEFWLYQTVRQKEKFFERSKSSKEDTSEENTSSVKILDIEMYPTFANIRNRDFWSWRILGKYCKVLYGQRTLSKSYYI